MCRTSLVETNILTSTAENGNNKNQIEKQFYSVC